MFRCVTADVVTRTRHQGGTGFFDANHWIFQETGQVLRVGFARDDAKGSAHTAEWCAGADVVFCVSLIAADKALVGLGQCGSIVCMVAGFELGRYLCRSERMRPAWLGLPVFCFCGDSQHLVKKDGGYACKPFEFPVTSLDEVFVLHPGIVNLRDTFE